MADQLEYQQLRALADPCRFRILQLMAREPICSCCDLIRQSEQGYCVSDMVELTGLSQPTVSYHLKALEECQLLRREKRGTWACYFINGQAIQEISAWLVAELLPSGSGAKRGG